MYRRFFHCLRLVAASESRHNLSYFSSISILRFSKPVTVFTALLNINMSQRSITSFFTKTPNRGSVSLEAGIHTSGPDKKDKSAAVNGNPRKPAKRQMLESSDSDKSDQSTPSSPQAKKSSKRQRIESCSSEDSPRKKSPIKNNKNGHSPVDKKVKKKTGAVTEMKFESVMNSSDGKKGDVQLGEDHLKAKVLEADYDPSKAKYDPIQDACWSHGEAVPYLALAKTLEVIEATSARLKMIEILSNYLRSVILLTPEDLLASIYLVLNQLAPAYHGVELGVAESGLLRAVAASAGRSVSGMRAALAAEGDLGTLAMKSRLAQRTLVTPPKLQLRNVLAALREIANMTGHASMNKKIQKIQNLYISCRHCEAKYLIRGLQGKLRVGLAEQSVLQSLALALAHSPPQQWPPRTLDRAKEMNTDDFKSLAEEYALIIKTTYCECPNYEMMMPVILSSGVTSLPQHCGLTPGIPLKPMLAHPTKGVREVLARFENMEFTCEYKYDGERAQIHIPGDVTSAKIFSRNQEDNSTKYPDIMRRLPALLRPSVKSCVLDTEAVAFDVTNQQILPFQVLSTRKRKDANESEIKVQVCVFVFDLLYLNGEPLVRQPLAARRQLLRDHFNEVPGEWQFAVSRDCTGVEAIQEFLEEAVKASCEGLMVKTLQGRDATYEIARRSHNWLKLKKDYLDGVGDTIDAVVIGAWHGRGKRAGNYGGFLLACFDPQLDQYQSLCKIGTGFTDHDLQSITELLKQHVIDEPRGYYRFDQSHTPDVWLSANCVCEVRCADLSLSPAHHAAIGLLQPDKGISLRFPRFVRIRDDKKPEDATTSQQIADLYMSQDQVKNQTSKPLQNTDDFY